MGKDSKIKTDTFFNLLEGIKSDFKSQNGRDLTMSDVAIVNNESPQYSGAFDISAIDKKEFADKAGTIFESEVAVVTAENLSSTNNNSESPKRMRVK